GGDVCCSAPAAGSMAGTGFAEPSLPERRPDWLKVKLRDVNAIARMKPVLSGLHTVCEEANCPNIGECWGRGTATFMILGDTCTRRCGFCNVQAGVPGGGGGAGRLRVAHAVAQMGLRHCVVTSVDRDDLPDCGAGIFADTIRAIRRRAPDGAVEVLRAHFRG